MSGSPGMDEAAWHALRHKHVGGSEVAALFGCQPDYALSLFRLWQVKAGRIPPPVIDNPRTQWGLKLEAIIAEACAEKKGWTIHKGDYVSDSTTPGLGCTLDYVIESDPTGQFEGPGALEIKNVDWLVYRQSWNDEPPLHILLQHQHQLAATNYKWGAIGGLSGGNDLHVYPYAARPRLIADIRKKVRAFWCSIEEGKEPDIDGTESTAAALRTLYPEPVEDVLDLTANNEAPEICAEYLAAVERRKAADKDEALAKNRLVALLGPHLVAETQGFRIRTAVTGAKPDRPAEPGEIIKGRAEARRYTVKEVMAA